VVRVHGKAGVGEERESVAGVKMGSLDHPGLTPSEQSIDVARPRLLL
jgi:hypothetical protein